MSIQKVLRPCALLLVVVSFYGSSLGCRTNDAGYESYIRALRSMKGGDSDVSPGDAASLINEAVRLSPENPQYRRTRSGFHFDKGDYQSSLEDSLKASELEGPQSSYPLYTAGLASGALGNYQEALQYFHEAIRRQPTNGQYQAGLAFAELNLKHYEVALREIDQAIKLNPNFQRWRYTRGLILSQAGKEQEAISEFAHTIVYSMAQPGGGIRDIYFDGDREFARCRSMQPEDMSRFWHYGGRWLSEKVYGEYRNVK